MIDVIIEGVSLLSNFRSQTQEVISQEGPDGLIRVQIAPTPPLQDLRDQSHRAVVQGQHATRQPRFGVGGRADRDRREESVKKCFANN